MRHMVIRSSVFDSRILNNHVHHFSSPWRIVDDCGGAFTMGKSRLIIESVALNLNLVTGTIGGAVFQSIKGFRNAPTVRKKH